MARLVDRSGWPPIRGIGWTRVPGPPIQRRTGDRVVDEQIQDRIELAMREPERIPGLKARAWSLYAQHGSFMQRLRREVLGALDSLATGLIWLVVVVLVLIAYNAFWDGF